MQPDSASHSGDRQRRRGLLALSLLLLLVVAGTLTACGGGSDSTEESEGPIPVGAIFDLSGPINVIGEPKANATELAIEDINANGGVLGRELELVSYDAASDLAQYPKYASQLIEQDNVAVLEAGITSAEREAIRPIIDRTETPYLYANLYEGGLCDKNVFLTGAVPSQQLAQLVPYATENFGNRFYIAAADYNFGHWESDWAKKYIEEAGGEVVGTDFVPLENTDFGSVLNNIQSSDPDVVVSLLVGGDQQSFYRQFTAAGLQDKYRIITPVFGDGQEQKLVGGKATDGVIIAYPYLQEIDTPANREFLKQFPGKVRCGRLRQSVGDGGLGRLAPVGRGGREGRQHRTRRGDQGDGVRPDLRLAGRPGQRRSGFPSHDPERIPR